jgi:hypothetical protein
LFDPLKSKAMTHTLQNIIIALLKQNGHEEWYPSEPIIVPLSDNNSYEIHGLKVSKGMELLVMGADEDGGPLTESDENFSQMVQAIGKRVFECKPDPLFEMVKGIAKNANKIFYGA